MTLLCPALAALALALALASPAYAAPRPSGCTAPDAPLPPPADGAAGRLALQTLVQEALRRSQAIGAARLLAEAAGSDAEQARAEDDARATLSASVGPLGRGGNGYASSSAVQGNAGVTLSAPLYDGGLRAQTLEARRRLAEAARQARLGAEEQVALQTVSLAVERSRLAAQAAVYGLYRDKMVCLVGALKQIVAADRGRGSELVQARKSLQQVELAREDVAAQQRQNEVRLRRYVGDELALPPGIALPPAPDLAQLRADVAASAEVLQLAAQAEAQDRFAAATVAGQRPQASWVVQGNRATGGGMTGPNWGWNAGITLNVPLLDPGARAGEQAARQRALAARAQVEDALEARQSRAADTLLQAQAAAERSGRIAEVLASSARVRDDTLLQWQQLGRRSLFDVMAAVGDYYGLLIARVDADHDGQQSQALAWSLGRGLKAGALP